MMMVIIAMVPALLFGMYNVGYWHYTAAGEEATWLEMFGHGLLRVLPLIIVSYGVGLGIEFIFCIRNGHAIQEGFLVSGMLIPLIMPVDVPLWMVGVATAFAVLIGKEVFGGTGMNILNVALTARAFLFFSHPTSMSGDKTWISGIKEMKADGTLVDSISGATSMGDLAAAKAKYGEAALKTGEEATNLIAEGDAMVAHLGTKEAFMDAFMGLEVGSIGETSALMILIGAALLLKTGIASWKVMISFFLGGLTVAGILNAVGGNPYFEFDPIHQLMLGGFMFGMVFMVTDPVTAAQTSTGKFVYGFIAGALGILIRMANPAYPEGVMLGILIANVCAPTIDHMVIRANVNKRLKRLKTA
jgi:Na+-transporting NADH:ubiquinone oxidoreductase subunit B